MPDEQEQHRIEVDRADRQVIEQAAAELRRGAILAGYACVEHKHVAFAFALVLEEIARQLAPRPILTPIEERTRDRSAGHCPGCAGNRCRLTIYCFPVTRLVHRSTPHGAIGRTVA
jgi:hypothetical protein